MGEPRPTIDRGSALAALTATSMLAAQVLVHRLVSLKFLNNYAFLVISLTMLGFGLSGVYLARILHRVERERSDFLAAWSGLFAATLVASAALLLGAGVIASDAATRPEFIVSFLRSIPYALIFAVPFTFGGLLLGTLLSARDYVTRRVYFFDLMGSATGAFVVLPVIGAVGVERAVVIVALLQVVGTCVLHPPRASWARGIAAAGIAVAVFAGVFHADAFALNAPGRFRWSPTRGLDKSAKLIETRWDPLGRAEMWTIDGAPLTFPLQSIFGDEVAFRNRFKRVLTQNNWAFSYAPYVDVPFEQLTGIERTMYATSYLASSVKEPRVAVIGVGGGCDVISALHFGAREVNGVEANGATLDFITRLDRPYFEKWAADPRVHIFHDEGRHFLASSDSKYDVIHLSGVDTYAGTPGAAHVFTENYLYTVEAFELYLSRLTDGGIVNVVRLEWPPPREGLRALTTAIAAERRIGVQHPAANIVIMGSHDVRWLAFMSKRTAFTDAELDKLEAGIADNPLLRVVASPRTFGKNENIYQGFLGLDDPLKEDIFLLSAPLNVAPVEDDRPFYFRFSYWWHLFPADTDTVVKPLIPTMELSVLFLLGVIGLIALVCIWLPLRAERRAASEGAEAGLSRFAVYFAALGLGYMAIEMALLQQFGLFLGHPSYALSVVLAGLLFATGVGALLADAIVKRLGGVRFVAYLLSGVVFLEALVVFPRLSVLLAASFTVRCAVTLALIAPLGICLGVFLPNGLEQLKVKTPRLVPWAWGVNGVFSVLGPILAIAAAITFGSRTLMILAVPIYLAAGWILPRATSETSESS